MSEPIRVQRRRTKGWRMPLCSCGCGKPAPNVGRGTEWGNPWRVGDAVEVRWLPGDGGHYHREFSATPEIVVALYRAAFTPDQSEACAELRGHDLACWCPLDSPCHGDVLLELANEGVKAVGAGGE